MGTKAPRNIRIEALRLVAICSIAIFHSFQPLFAHMTELMGPGLVPSAGDAASLVAATPAVAGLLGFINLFGAYGNCVFFAISGLFLIPSAARASRETGYLRDQLARTARRAAVILLSVALYAVVALIVSARVVPLPGVSLHETGWLIGGLEFIWVYLAMLVITPLIGWLWERCRARVGLTALIVAAIYLINAYIAFVSPGNEVRGLLEWRKLMSAASYGAAFIAGGALSDVLGKNALSYRAATAALAGAASLSLVGEIWLAANGRGDLMVATSFKSTSAISFVLAWLSLAVAAHPEAPRKDHPMAAPLITRAAGSILGFYIAQSMFYALWRRAVDALMSLAFAGGSSLSATIGVIDLVAAGIAGSLAVVAILIAVDALTRMPLLRLVRLQR